MPPSPLDELLRQLARELRCVRRRARRRALAEVRDHLLAATDDAIAGGAERMDAERRAAATFGDLPEIGSELARLHHRRGGRGWRVLALTVLMALIAAGAAGPLDHDGLVRPDAAAAGPVSPTAAQCVTAFNAPANARWQADARASGAARASVSVVVSLKPSTGRFLGRRCLVEFRGHADEVLGGLWSHGAARFTRVRTQTRFVSLRAADALVAANGHLTYVGRGLSHRVQAEARQALSIDVVPAAPSVGLPVTLATSVGGHLMVIGPLPSRRTWRVALEGTGSRRVGRFAFPLAGRYRLAVAGRVPTLVRVRGRQLAVRREPARRYSSSPESVLPAHLGPGVPDRVWSIGVGTRGARFVWFETRGTQECSVTYLTRPRSWVPLESVSVGCDPIGTRPSSPLTVATMQPRPGQAILVALVTTAADEIRIVPRFALDAPFVRSIPNVGPLVAPGRRLVLLPLGRGGVLRVLALRTGRVLASA